MRAVTPAELAAIVVRLDSTREQLDRIEAHVEKTNGRVTKLELWQAKLIGAGLAARWMPPVVTAVVSGLVIWVLTGAR